MLELTGDHIAELNDDDVRRLVGLLCEAEFRSHGLAPASITWGGNQNAADGGIDVRIEGPSAPPSGGFIPRVPTGLQVKKTDFIPSLIKTEMRPSGVLRPSINDLITRKGAYIIASSGADTSDSALSARLAAMRSAVSDTTGHEWLFLDFYDRNRLATWARNHPGIVLWVRQRIGRSISGWKTYSAWANSPDGLDDVYLLDDKARLHVGITDEKGIDVAQGLERIRSSLRAAHGVVRLTGLSGVGKTRLVQALFDSRIGENALDSSLVVYTDMNDQPDPQPVAMVSDLIASGSRAMVVVDNCAPDLHRRLTELCHVPESQICAVTVEYDVQDDEPEGTEVYRLEPSSTELVATLIKRRFPALTELDVHKISNFSGGNARVALALANTLERNETVAGLQDEELFKRLFYQRQERDQALLKAAQACALVYSFQGETLTGDDAELSMLGALAGMTAQQLYGKVAQLKQRDLVQSRSIWRAILPHAIANRLAKLALAETPLETIEQTLTTERLMKSFTRRLSFLDDSPHAARIAEKWLAKDGYLANIGLLNQFGMAMFVNIAPISLDATLTAIERELAGENAARILEESWRRDRIGSVLRSLAYDATLFERSVSALIRLAAAETPSDTRTLPSEGALEGLFHLFLSGTHATIEQRIQIVTSLLNSTNARYRELGLDCLKALLQAEHFTGTHSFEFGARVRDYGYWPETRSEKVKWYASVLTAAEHYTLRESPIGPAVRAEIAHSLRSIWFLGVEVQDAFERIGASINAAGFWHEGWIATRSVLSRPLDKADPEAVDRLKAFEAKLRPTKLSENIHAVVLSQSWGPLDFAEMDEDEDAEPVRPIEAYERAAKLAVELGKEAANNISVLDTLMPDLVTGEGRRLPSFGQGLALAAESPRALWYRLTQALGSAKNRNAGLLMGFLLGLSTVDAALTEALLDEAVDHDTLAEWFPALQTSVPISKAGAERLKRAVALGMAKAGAFSFLGWGRPTDAVSGQDLKELLLALAKMPDGYKVAIDILSMRFYADKDQQDAYPTELIETGRFFLSHPTLVDRDHNADYHLRTVATVCLKGPDGAEAARALCEYMKKGFSDYSLSAYSWGHLLQSIFKAQPTVALDVFFLGTVQADGSILDIDDFDDPGDRRKNPLDEVSSDVLLGWCESDPATRYPAIARAISYFRTGENGSLEWTPLALELMRRSPDRISILKTFAGRFAPSSWSGSRAAIIESRLILLEQLGPLDDAVVADYAREFLPSLREQVSREREWENKRDSDRDERFE
jgi:hypothetical protein